MSRRRKRTVVNEPPKMWFHGQDATERVLLGLIEPKAESKPAPIIHLVPKERQFLARYAQQRCLSCDRLAQVFEGYFERVDSGVIRAVPTTVDCKREAKPVLDSTYDIHQCYACATQGAQRVTNQSSRSA